MTKIIYIIDHLIQAGTQMHLYHLVKELDQTLYQPIVICLEEKGPLADELEKQNIPIIAFHTKAIYSLDSIKKWFKLIFLLRKEKPLIIQTFLLKANLMGVLAAKFAKIPIILSSRRSLGYDFKPSHYNALKMVDRFVTATVVNCKAIQDITINREKIERKRLPLIYNGVVFNKSKQLPDQRLRQALKIPPQSIIIGCVANIRPIKGYEYFIESMKTVVTAHPHAHFLIVGNRKGHEDYFSVLLKQIRALSLEKHVTIWSDCQDIPSALSLIDIAVLPSLSEGFSNTLLEYMAAEKPIVATNVGGNQEAIIHNSSGLLIPPKNSDVMAAAINQLINDPKKSAFFAQNARDRVKQNFSMEQMIDSYHLYYQQAIERPVPNQKAQIAQMKFRGVL